MRIVRCEKACKQRFVRRFMRLGYETALALVPTAPAFARTQAQTAQTEAQTARTKTELTVLPLAGGDSDVGFGGGLIGSAAGVAPVYDPYLWRVESAALLTFKQAPGSGVDVPFQDYYVKVSLPHLLPNRLRLDFRASFNWLSTLKYYGLGNASHFGPEGPYDPEGPTRRYFEYERINPIVRSTLRVALAEHVELVLGNFYTQNWIKLAPDSKLALDMKQASPVVRELLGDAREHAVLGFEYGLAWDLRDNETSTVRGMFHEAKLTLAPGSPATEVPYRFGNVNLMLRFFQPLGSEQSVLAVRLVGDALFGRPPFYELPRYDDSYAIGGSRGVRGVLAQRFYGKLKVFGNLEIRQRFFEFRLGGKLKYTVGAVAFADVGRVWADYRPLPELDGRGLGLKLGVGGGLRLRAGKTFVLRGDFAYSPTEGSTGGYFAAGEMF